MPTARINGFQMYYEVAGQGVPLLCLETALPVKFAETIREALGRDPERPAEFIGLEEKPQRVAVIDNDAEVVKRHIAAA